MRLGARAVVDRYVNPPLVRADIAAAVKAIRWGRPGESPFGDPALRALFETASSAGPDERNDMVRQLAAMLDMPNAYRASCVALCCGALVELGADPTIAGLAIVNRLRSAAIDQPVDRGAVRQLDRAAMAHLCRSTVVRQAARHLPAITEVLAPYEAFTARVLELVDDLVIHVLAPDQRKGFRVRLHAVATNGHMFTLLQGALIGGDRLVADPVDPAVLAIATGEVIATKSLSDHQRFRFDTWRGLATTNSLRADFASWIPVEGSPRDLPIGPSGLPVVLLGPPLIAGRSWDSNFFANMHGALRSRAIGRGPAGARRAVA